MKLLNTHEYAGYHERWGVATITQVLMCSPAYAYMQLICNTCVAWFLSVLRIILKHTYNKDLQQLVSSTNPGIHNESRMHAIGQLSVYISVYADKWDLKVGEFNQRNKHEILRGIFVYTSKLIAAIPCFFGSLLPGIS